MNTQLRKTATETHTATNHNRYVKEEGMKRDLGSRKGEASRTKDTQQLSELIFQPNREVQRQWDNIFKMLTDWQRGGGWEKTSTNYDFQDKKR